MFLSYDIMFDKTSYEEKKRKKRKRKDVRVDTRKKKYFQYYILYHNVSTYHIVTYLYKNDI